MRVVPFLVAAALGSSLPADQQSDPLRVDALKTMRRAAEFYRTKVASHGGYVYYYSLDLTQRRGEGDATADQIWVEPPGTPTVGMAYLTAYAATGESFYLDAALETGEALIYGQPHQSSPKKSARNHGGSRLSGALGFNP